MTSPALLDRATIRHNLTEFKVRWLAHIDEWRAENRPATESSHDQQFWGDRLGGPASQRPKRLLIQAGPTMRGSGRICYWRMLSLCRCMTRSAVRLCRLSAEVTADGSDHVLARVRCLTKASTSCRRRRSPVSVMTLVSGGT